MAADGSISYDSVCAAVRELTGAGGTVLIILEGHAGNGVSMMMPPDAYASLPRILRTLARAVELHAENVPANCPLFTRE